MFGGMYATKVDGVLAAIGYEDEFEDMFARFLKVLERLLKGKEMLTCVTLTGADDTVEPVELIKLSQEFPFLEWGILIGSSTGGRFPSRKWIRELVRLKEIAVAANHTVNLSLHICGQPLRDIAAGKSSLIEDLPCVTAFERCQLNWHGERKGSIGHEVYMAFSGMKPWWPEIIFQLDGVNDELHRNLSGSFEVAGLFDRSHGAGVLPDSWPHGRPDIRCGWAGGLGPDNVDAEFEKIEKQATEPFWIDMETKLFTDGRFDLAKCRSVALQMDSAARPRGGMRSVNRGI